MARNPDYPILLRLAGRRALVVGGGQVGLRRVRGLLEARAEVTVVAPEPAAELVDLAAERRISLRRRRFEPGDAGGVQVLFACADDAEVNAIAAAAARAAGALVTVADDPEASDFSVPALHREGPLTLSVGTSGCSPSLARRLKDRAAGTVTVADGRLAELLARVRHQLQTLGPGPAPAAEAFDALLDAEPARLLDDRAALDALLRSTFGEGCTLAALEEIPREALP